MPERPPGSRPAALVTGAARGIGRGVALALAGAGHDVAVHYRASRGEAEAVCAEARALGVEAVALQADVSQRPEARALVTAAHARFGRLDVLVNNVGNYVSTPFDALTDAEWDDMLASNLGAVFATCQTALPLMRAQGGGRVVNLGFAGAPHTVLPTIVAYVAAKTGVVVLTRTIAAAEARHGITANVVAPGVIENSVAQPVEEIPAGRLGLVQEVSNSVLFLVSAAAEYVTGQVIEVAGGWNL